MRSDKQDWERTKSMLTLQSPHHLSSSKILSDRSPPWISGVWRGLSYKPSRQDTFLSRKDKVIIKIVRYYLGMKFNLLLNTYLYPITRMTNDEATAFLDLVISVNKLNNLQELVFRKSWEGLSYVQIAEQHGYDPEYIKQVGSHVWQMLSQELGFKISKSNFRAVLRRYIAKESEGLHEHQETWKGLQTESVNEESLYKHSSEVLSLRQDWGAAIESYSFYGREQELKLLSQWILGDASHPIKNRCRIVTLLGMGGIGKTSLSLKLAKQICEQFDFVIWRSLQNAPPFLELLTDLIQFLFPRKGMPVPDATAINVSLLINFFQTSRCLVILDNMESILRSGDSSGSFRLGYEDYALFFKQAGEENHQSCLLLTSRERPRPLEPLAGELLPVRFMFLPGLVRPEVIQIFQMRGSFLAADKEWDELIAHYAGNPLALQMVAPVIQDLFDGNVSQFLELLNQGTLIFNDIRNLIDLQWQRLSAKEQEIMYWLAIEREPISLSDLCDRILPSSTNIDLLEALMSLSRRSLIEKITLHELNKNITRFTLQPVIMEYVIQKFVDTIHKEIVQCDISHFNNFALIEAQTKDYVREIQTRLILKPIAEQLLTSLNSTISVQEQLKQILSFLRSHHQLQQGYGSGNLLNLICYLKVNLTEFNFSGLTVREAYLQGVPLHNVNFSQCVFQNSVFSQAFAATLSVAFHPNGEILATGNANGEVHLWRVSDGQILLTCRGHANWVRRVAFSPDGKKLASGSEDRTMRIWDLSSGECLSVIKGEGFSLRTLAFSPDGRNLVSGSDDAIVRVWDPVSGICLRQIAGHTGWVISLAFSADGNLLASSSTDETLRIWQFATGTCLKEIRGHQGWVVPVGFSQDGKRLISAGFDCTVRIWDVEHGDCMRVLQGHTAWVWAATFSPDGRLVASAGVDGTIRTWDSETGECLHVLKAHTSQVWSLAFHPDGKLLASSSDDQTIRFWDARDGKCLRVIRGYTNWIKSVAFSLDGEILISGSKDGLVRVWDVQTQECSHILKDHKEGATTVAIHPASQLIASGNEDCQIKIWNLVDRSCYFTLQGHAQPVWSVAFSPDGKWLASSSFDRTIRIWNVSDWSCLHVLEGHADRVGSIAFNPESSIVASASEDMTVKLWDVDSGKCIHTLKGHTNRVLAVAIAPSGDILASGGMDNAIRLWDIRTGEHLQTLEGHSGWILSLAWSPNGADLASCGCDRTIKVWHIANMECRHTFQGHTNWVWSVAFSPDGRVVASSGEDETIRLWDTSLPECSSTLHMKRLYEGMNITNTKGLTEAQKVSLRELGAK
jgi:WD40 repeat protein